MRKDGVWGFCWALHRRLMGIWDGPEELTFHCYDLLDGTAGL